MKDYDFDLRQFFRIGDKVTLNRRGQRTFPRFKGTGIVTAYARMDDDILVKIPTRKDPVHYWAGFWKRSDKDFI